MTYTGFASFKTYTDDGETWSYGYGEYNKTLADAGVTYMPPTLATVLGLSSTLKQLASQTLVPTFYIWARDDSTSNTKYLVEWPYARSVRDARFDSFAAEFKAAKSNADHFSVVLKYQSGAPSYNVTNLVTYAGAEKAAKGVASLVPLVNTTPPKTLPGNDANTHGYMLLVVAGALLVAYLLYKR